MKRRILAGLALALAALSATPAAAQDAGLGWLMGKWCVDSQKQGTLCLTYKQREDGAIAVLWASESKDVEVPEHSLAVMRIVDGRVVLHSDDEDSDFAEVSRGPNELVLETTRDDVVRDGVRRVEHRREGDVLVMTMELGNGQVATDRYYRAD